MDESCGKADDIFVISPRLPFFSLHGFLLVVKALIHHQKCTAKHVFGLSVTSQTIMVVAYVAPERSMDRTGTSALIAPKRNLHENEA